MKLINYIVLCTKIHYILYKWSKLSKIELKIDKEKQNLSLYKKIFIKDEEDLKLNKLFIEGYELKINLLNKKYLSLSNSIKYSLLKNNIFNWEKFLFNCYKANISSELVNKVKEIYIHYFKVLESI